MTEHEAIEMLKSMQNPLQDYANMVGAPAFASGYRYVYPEPEDYAIEEAINALKEKQNRSWIPVSERMPDESGYYCVTTEDTETDGRIEQTIWFAHKDDYDIKESEWRELADYEKVIAWRKSDPYNQEFHI